ncbi:MAG: aminofutalosine synthase MqnE [Euryarchaeota archaeon]|nr:aminofutalosine synthase MqnE [Euryarchaeota archaeon]
MTEWSSTVKLAGCEPNWKSNVAKYVDQFKWSDEILPVVKKVRNGERLDMNDGILLYNHLDIFEVGLLATCSKKSRFGDFVFFNSNVHINQTNVCVLSCKFCAFSRTKRSKDAYSLSIQEYLTELEKYSPLVDEVHSVGGLHPDWDVEYYSELFSAIKDRFPNISIKALTAVEIKHLSKVSNISIDEVFKKLIESGLDSLPGGGAEILNDEIRDIICYGKETSSEYIEIHRAAHKSGIPSNCTMLFGTIESLEDRIEHMFQIRNLADETSMVQCFVPYPFLPDSTRLPEAQLATSNEILRTIAISRLILDNVPHIKAYRMNIGDNLAELALNFGADDVDGTVGRESIMHLAGATSSLDFDKYQLGKLITDAGCIPIIRDTKYENFSRYVIKPPKKVKRLKMAV